MRDSVRRAYANWTMQFEGLVPFMYLDEECLVTTALGNLIDPIQMAMPLPFVRPDGSYASRNEIAVEWLRVKARTDLAPCGGMAFKRITTLRLPPEGIDRLVFGKLDLNDLALAKRFSAYTSWPADAQLAVLSMSWACGSEFEAEFPKFSALMERQDFVGAATECAIHDRFGKDPGTLHLRNVADVHLLHNAASVLALGLDPEILWYPRTPSSVPADEDTQPDLAKLADFDPDDAG
jgi:hypothetical protein